MSRSSADPIFLWCLNLCATSLRVEPRDQAQKISWNRNLHLLKNLREDPRRNLGITIYQRNFVHTNELIVWTGSPSVLHPLQFNTSVPHKRATTFQLRKSLTSSPKTPQFNTSLISTPKISQFRPPNNPLVQHTPQRKTVLNWRLNFDRRKFQFRPEIISRVSN